MAKTFSFLPQLSQSQLPLAFSHSSDMSAKRLGAVRNTVSTWRSWSRSPSIRTRWTYLTPSIANQCPTKSCRGRAARQGESLPPLPSLVSPEPGRRQCRRAAASYRGAALQTRSVPAQPEMETERFPLVSIPPFGRGFSRHGGLSIRWGFRKSAKDGFRARLDRLDEPARLSLGMVASPQSPLPFHLAEPL
jgi:hypothetical protein